MQDDAGSHRDSFSFGRTGLSRRRPEHAWLKDIGRQIRSCDDERLLMPSKIN